MPRVSEEPTPYAVHCFGFLDGMECRNGDPIYLTEEEYNRQLSLANRRWQCPLCGCEAWWDDDIYEEAFYD